LRSQDIDYVLKDGTIRISTFSHYRSLENQGIGDQAEASTIVNVENFTLKDVTAEPWRPEGFSGAFR